MTDTIKPADYYIVADNEGVIRGWGRNQYAAWADAKATFKKADIALLTDIEDSTGHPGSWYRLSNLRFWPASELLIHNVKVRGGAIAWHLVGGVARIPGEEE